MSWLRVCDNPSIIAQPRRHRRPFNPQLTDAFRHLNGVGVGLALVAAYAVLRLLALPEIVVQAWAAVAVAATLVSPVAGLTVLAAIAPFTEALTADGRITPVPFLIAAAGVSVAPRVLLSRPLPRPSGPLLLAIVILVGTFLGVLHSWLRYGMHEGLAALQLWVPGIGGGMTVLLASAWAAWRGETRPLGVAVVAVVVAALLSVLDFLSRGQVQATLLGELLRSVDWWRLGGVLPAPNAAAAMFLGALAACLAAAVIVPSRQLRVAALIGSGITLVASILTFSRSGLLAIGLIVIVVAWLRWRARGVLAAGLVAATAAALAAAFGTLREVPAFVDAQRLIAWRASLELFLAEPLIGSGFRSFEWLHVRAGSPILNAPHNEWLRLFAEQGAVVGLAGVAFAVLTPIALLRSRQLASVAAGVAAAGLFLMAAFNNPFTYAQVTVPGFLIIGAGLGVAMRRTPAA